MASRAAVAASRSRRKPQTLRVPQNVHPLVSLVYEAMNAQRVGLQDTAARAGVDYRSISDWKSRKTPSLRNLEAVLNTLGFDLVAVKR